MLSLDAATGAMIIYSNGGRASLCVAVVDGGPAFDTVTLVFSRRGTIGGCVLGSDTLIALAGRFSSCASVVSSSGDGDRKRGGGCHVPTGHV